MVGLDHYINSQFPIEDGLYLIDGTIIGERYQISGFIGKGYHWKVYSAIDLHRTKKVALKIKLIDAGEYENDTLSSFNHHYKRIENTSHVIQIFDSQLVPWQGTKLMVVSMELADGGTFEDWLKSYRNKYQTRMTIGLDLFIQACEGFSALHQADIIPQIVAPKNLLLVNQGIKVTDYLTFITEPSILCGNGAVTNKFTKSPLVPIYMSPEQFVASDPADIDERSNVYSLGIILFELLDPQGQSPFSGSYDRLREMHIEGLPVVSPDMDEKFLNIISRCLVKDPADRYQTANELIAELNVILDQGSDSNQLGETVDSHKSSSVNDLWEQARECYTMGDFIKTTAIIEEVLVVEPNHSPALGLKSELHERFIQTQSIYNEVALNIDRDLETATGLLEKAVNLYPNHPAGYEVQTKLSYRLSIYRRSMEEGYDALKRADWETALAWFQNAIEMNPGEINLISLTDRLSEIVALRKQIKSALQQGDINRAQHLAYLVDIETENLPTELSL
jgi:serine/threonine-protein kinase